MATYYVRTDGNNSNTGTGTGTGQAWATIGKALGATGIASGDTVYIKPGVYKELVTVAIGATAETQVIGDTDGAVFGTKGEVIWSAFTAGDDSAPTGVPCSLNGQDYITFRRLTFYGDDVLNSASCINASVSVSTNCKVEQCVFAQQGPIAGGGSRAIQILIPNNISIYWTIDRCVFAGRQTSVFLDTRSLATGSDWNSELEIKNCLFLNSTDVIIAQSNVGANIASRPSHGKVTNCTFFGNARAVRFNNAGAWSTTNGMDVRNCLIYSNTTAGLEATSSGQMTSDYNRLIDNNVNYTNVTAGANDITTGIFGLDLGAGLIQDGLDRDFWMPSQTINPAANTSIQPSVDILGDSRTGTSTIGAYLDTDIIPAGGGLLVHPGMTGGIRG